MKKEFQSVRNVMTPMVEFIDGMATAKEAVVQMRQKNVDALIVKRRHPNDVCGIVVIKDFIKGVIISERNSDEVNVYEIMTKPVISVPADMDVRYAAMLLVKAGLRIAPVEEKGEFIGMISLSTLVLGNLLF
ncbi:MAG: CBS domain-containing protein [Bacteroidales bacterium]|nr:CBS domain-containing protein [Bacteroidales bacterium]